MEWLRFSKFSIGNVTTFIILCVILVYLLRIKKKTSASWFLFGYIAGLALLLLSYVIRYSVITTVPFQTAAASDSIVFTLALYVLFAYNFPKNENRLESRIVPLVFICISAFVYVSSMLLEQRVFSFSAHYYARQSDPKIALVAGVEYIWAAVIFVRKAIAAKTRYKNIAPKSFLAFGLLTLATFTISFSYALFTLGIITRVAYGAIFNNGALIISFSIFIVYINNSRVPSSLRWKVVGISLSTMLVVIGIAANILDRAVDSSYDTQAEMAAKQVRSTTDHNPVIPDGVAYLASWSAGSGQTPLEYQVIYAENDDITPEDLLDSDRWIREAENDEKMAPLLDAHGDILANQEFKRRYRYFDIHDTTTYFYHYDFFHNDRVFEVGFSYLGYRLHIHRVLSQLVYVVLATTALVLLIYPIFYRQGLLTPFNKLMSVIREVNDGRFDVQVPVFLDDEIGFMSRSFNIMIKKLKSAFDEIAEREYETLHVMGRAAEYRDPETANHIARVAHYSRMLAEVSGEERDNLNLIFYSSPLHDIGKLGVPDSILLKNDRLSSEEYAAIKAHSQMGYDMLKESESRFLQSGAVIALTHHEKFDGTGYPKGIDSEDIHIFGRIVAVADVFDALTTSRPYKEPWPIEKALEVIKDGRGGQFDPKIVDCFFDNLDTVVEIRQRYPD